MLCRGIFDVPDLRRKLTELNDRSTAEDVWSDRDQALVLLQERSLIESQVVGFDRLNTLVIDLGELLAMAADEKDEAVVEDIAGQIPEIESSIRKLEVARMLCRSEDICDAIITIHPGTGGREAQDWASILMRMYYRWAERKGFKIELIDLQYSEAGIKEACFIVRGAHAYGFLRAENGVHRLQRISPFDQADRRQTSCAGVFIVPDLDESKTDIVIKPEDIIVDTFRSGGKGGQHVNKVESAIRITHIATGIIVKCQAERSQHKNRSHAMKMLLGRLYEQRRQEREAEFEKTYAADKMENGFGSQIRTWTMTPYQMVKDERTGFKANNVDEVLDGDLDQLIESYLLWKSSNE